MKTTVCSPVCYEIDYIICMCPNHIIIVKELHRPLYISSNSAIWHQLPDFYLKGWDECSQDRMKANSQTSGDIHYSLP